MGELVRTSERASVYRPDITLRHKLGGNWTLPATPHHARILLTYLAENKLASRATRTYLSQVAWLLQRDPNAWVLAFRRNSVDHSVEDVRLFAVDQWLE